MDERMSENFGLKLERKYDTVTLMGNNKCEISKEWLKQI